MAIVYNTSIIKDGLVMCLDAANPKSYPGIGTTWTDLSGNGRNGTLINGPTFSSNNNGNIVFDGVNDYGTIPHSSAFNVVSTPFTVIVWNKKNDTSSGFNGLITADLASDNHWKIFKDANQTFYQSRTGSTALAFPNYVINEWHMYAFTKSESTLTNYFNGLLISSNTSASSPISFSNDLAIGSYRLNDAIAGQYLMNQSFGKIMFYNRALTATEIRQNFEALRGRYGI